MNDNLIPPLTSDQVKRMSSAFVEKHHPTFDAFYGQPEAFLKSVMGTVIADTEMVLRGTLSIEDFEETP